MNKHCSRSMTWVLTMGFLLVPLFGWGQYQQSITFNGYSRSETLTNFPALVTFTNYTGFLSTQGYDLRFWTNSAATGTPLNYEIDSWTNPGTSFVWVQVPALTSNTSIWATWGNPAYNTQAAYTTNGATWSGNYAGVWHMATSNLLDSSGNGASTIAGVNTNAPGLVDGAQYFNGVASTSGSVPIVPSINHLTFFSISSWIRSSSANAQQILTRDNPSVGRAWQFSLNANNKPGFIVFTNLLNGNYSNVGVTSPSTIDGGWHYVSGVYSPSQISLFVDGNAVTNSITSGAPMIAAANNLWFGRAETGSSSPFLGTIDETRIASVPHDTNWVWAEYLNTASNSAFQTYGTAYMKPSPSVVNNGFTRVGPHTAYLSGTLVSTGTAQTAWGVIWGTNDPGPTLSGWLGGGQRNLGAAGSTPLTVTNLVMGLQPGQINYFRYWASNANGLTVADPAISFNTVGGGNSMPIAFPGYTNKTETLTNFPVLVVLSNNMVSGFTFNSFVSTNGWDLRFVTNLLSTNYLNYEIESWNTNPGQACYVWVQVPALPGNGSGLIYATWGDPYINNAQLPCTTNGATWTNGYVSVWHMKEGAGTVLHDSASTNNGTLYNAPVWTNGLIGNAVYFNNTASNYASMGNPAALRPTFPFTFSTLANCDWTLGAILVADQNNITNNGNYAGWGVQIGTPGAIAALSGTDAGYNDPSYRRTTTTSGYPITSNSWHQTTVVYASIGSYSIYVDGILQSTTSSGGGGSMVYDATNSFQLAAFYNAANGVEATNYSRYSQEEVSLASVSRSSNWVWAVYQNMASNMAFNVAGSVTSIPIKDPPTGGTSLVIE